MKGGDHLIKKIKLGCFWGVYLIVISFVLFILLHLILLKSFRTTNVIFYIIISKSFKRLACFEIGSEMYLKGQTWTPKYSGYQIRPALKRKG